MYNTNKKQITASYLPEVEITSYVAHGARYLNRLSHFGRHIWYILYTLHAYIDRQVVVSLS